VFRIGIALAGLVRSRPASVSTGAAIAVCLAPEDCASFAVSTIDSAEREILVSAYQLTVGPGAVGALIRANERGVDVRLLADREAPSERASGLTRWPWRVCQCG
jgi:phosphatidylserine/phosphatidylglycerophosphate/cardiolipin synthase-like enzyme